MLYQCVLNISVYRRLTSVFVFNVKYRKKKKRILRVFGILLKSIYSNTKSINKY